MIYVLLFTKYVLVEKKNVRWRTLYEILISITVSIAIYAIKVPVWTRYNTWNRLDFYFKIFKCYLKINLQKLPRLNRATVNILRSYKKNHQTIPALCYQYYNNCVFIKQWLIEILYEILMPIMAHACLNIRLLF